MMLSDLTDTQSRLGQIPLGVRPSLPAKTPIQSLAYSDCSGLYISEVSLECSRLLEEAEVILRTECLLTPLHFVMTSQVRD